MKRVLFDIAYPFVQAYLFFFPGKKFDPHFNGSVLNAEDKEQFIELGPEFPDNPTEGTEFV